MTKDDLPYEPVDRDRWVERARLRERLLLKIEFLIDEYFQAQIDECGEMGEMSNFLEAKLALTHDICDAVCQYFPLPMEAK